MQVQKIDGHWFVAVSCWDAGQVLNVDDPANPVFVTDSDYKLLTRTRRRLQIAEGNSHQSYWSSTASICSPATRTSRRRGRCSRSPVAPTRALSAPARSAGPRHCRVWPGRRRCTGSGCEEDTDSNRVSDRAQVPSAGRQVPTSSSSPAACFFSKKTESGRLAGYDGVIVAQSHAGTRNGLLPDAFICGSKGHNYTPTVPAICIGHRASHLLFNDDPNYFGPDIAAGGDMPAIGTLGESVSARNTFDGWGYIHQHDGKTLVEQDTYAVPEALDPAYATGFGNLTVHEVKTDPRAGKYLAASWYDAGLQVLKFGPGGITEAGHFIGGGGNDFWGVAPLQQGKTGPDSSARPLLLMSDRDSGLWIFRYTGE